MPLDKHRLNSKIDQKVLKELKLYSFKNLPWHSAVQLNSQGYRFFHSFLHSDSGYF